MPGGGKSKLAFFSIFCLGLLAPLFGTTTAAASRPHQFIGAFGSKCIAEPCTGESLKKPAGVAVNEETGDVYVVDEGADRVARFDREGNFLSEFDGSGALPGEASAAGALGRGGEVDTGRFEGPQGVAVDNSCLLRKLSKAECEAQDPSSGDVYVMDAGINHRVIDKYSAAGEYLGQITEGEEGGVKERFGRALDGVAVGPDGNVWIYQETRVLQKYDDQTPNAFLEAKGISLPCCGEPGFAIDGQGAFYVSHGEEANRRIAKLASTGNVIRAELLAEGASSVAADQLANNVLIDNPTSVAVLNPAMEEVERLGEENGERHLAEAAGVGVDSSGGSLYVGEDASAPASAVVVFGLAQASTPRIEDESFAEVTARSARLVAQINPLSEEGEAPTTYRFEYGRCLAATRCPESGYEASVPVPAGQIQADFESHTVATTLEGLQPATTYHFRVLAQNGHGEGEPGAEGVLATQGSGGPLALPDGRGWELVSPPDKLGAQIEPISETGVVQAAAGGGAVTYLANTPTEAEPQGYTNEVQILSRRETAAWSTRDIAIPHTSPTGLASGPGPEYKFFSPELQLSALQPFGRFIPQLSEEANQPTAYLHDLGEGCGSGCFRPLVTGKSGMANVPEGTQFGEEESCPLSNHIACGPEFLGATEDISSVVLRSNVALLPGTIGGELYEWSAGALTPVSVLPGGAGPSPAPNGLGNERRGAAQRAISNDGTRIVWESHEALYLRDTARGETVQLDKAECETTTGCSSGGGRVQIASADGSRIYFTDTHKLSADAGAEPIEQRADLYECKIIVSAGELDCELSDLTPKQGSEAADVQGSVLGASEDGSHIYFVAEGVVSGAANALGQHAVAGKPNLYLLRGASTSFVTTLARGDETDWGELAGTPEPQRGQPTRVSPDGRFLELMSEARLTGYDNRDVTTGEPAAEVYLYDATSGHLVCASCEPSGARPVGLEYHKLEPGSGGLVGGPRDVWPATALVAANVPGWTAMALDRSRYQPRYLSGEGRLFFDSADALVPQDTNGTQDVYEYETPGVGSCSESVETYSARSGGCVALISSGQSTQESAFLDASESGDDVFFLSSAHLARIDTDTARDVYDAHVCTGAEPCIAYARSEETSCDSETACKGAAGPPLQIYGEPASATLPSTGNIAPATGPANVTTNTKKRKSAEQIRRERLAKALKACHAKTSKKKRKACERAAHKRYAKPGSKAKAKAKRRGGGR